jgi:hypothetical protein
MKEHAKLKAVRRLREYNHVFLSEKGVAGFAADFGVKILPSKYYEDLKDPKGLTLDDSPDVHKDKKGRFAYGLDAQVLAMRICQALGVSYEEKLGRGSQLRACCDALERHFGGD